MRAACRNDVAAPHGLFDQASMQGELFSRLVAARDYDERYFTRRSHAGDFFAMAFQSGEVLGHRVKALRIAPHGLHDGMNIRWKLPHFTHQPFQRSGGSRTEDSD